MVTEVTVEVAVAWPVKRGALVVVARVAVCLKKELARHRCGWPHTTKDWLESGGRKLLGGSWEGRARKMPRL